MKYFKVPFKISYWILLYISVLHFRPTYLQGTQVYLATQQPCKIDEDELSKTSQGGSLQNMEGPDVPH